MNIIHLFLLSLCCFTSSLIATEKKPNILFIFSDDWGWGDLSCHGHPYIKTPNIDRLANEGTDFYRFTVASGVCSPSRTAVMTGHFPARYSIDGHFAWVPSNAKRGMPDWLDTNVPMVQRMLQKAGYKTAHFGKWHLANDMIPDSPTPDHYAFDTYGAFNCAGEQMPYHEDSMHAVNFIKKCNKEKKPFYINLWIHEPHTPFHTQPKYMWRFRNLEEKDQIYASVLSHADDRIGEILDALDELEIADNTVVIFSSDNGPARPSKPGELLLSYDTATGAGWGINGARGVTGGRKGYKGALMEGGICVPFIVRWPNKVAKGKLNKTSPISAVDLLPTFCSIAGAEMPKGYQPDGIDQLDALLGKNDNPIRSKPLFWKINAPWPARNDKPNHWVSWAVVYKKWKLSCNKDMSYHELYDAINDPLEKNDLASENAQIVKEMKNLLMDWQKTLPDKPSGNVFSKLRKK